MKKKFSILFALILGASSLALAANKLWIGQVVYYSTQRGPVVGEVSSFSGNKTTIKTELLNGARYIGFSETYPTNQASIQVACAESTTRNRVCSGTFVHGNNGADLVGFVRRVFENGIAEINWTHVNGATYSGALSYWTVDQLAPKVEVFSPEGAPTSFIDNLGRKCTATISRIFSDNRVELIINSIDGRAYQGNLFYVDASTLWE